MVHGTASPGLKYALNKLLRRQSLKAGSEATFAGRSGRLFCSKIIADIKRCGPVVGNELLSPRQWKSEEFMRRYFLQLVCFVAVALVLVSAQEAKAPAPAAAQPGAEYSGMYNFLREGELVQITVEDEGHVTGFISRYGDSEGDRGSFLDQFFKQGKLEGTKLSFTTETVHGIWFEFRGTVERGAGKKSGDEAYYVLTGTLTENATDAAKKTTSKARDVALKSFPQDMAPTPDK